MKKFLSVFLALAILIVPVGTMSSFANGEQYGEVGFSDLLRTDTIDQITVQIGTDPTGEVMFSGFLIGERGRILKIFKIPDQRDMRFIERFGFVSKLKEWKRGSAWVLFDFKVNGNIVAYARYYDCEGECIKGCNYKRAIKSYKCMSFYRIEDRLVRACNCLMKSDDDDAFLSAEERLAAACDCLVGDCDISFFR